MIHRYPKHSAQEKMDALVREDQVKPVDKYELYLRDLFEVRHPHLYKKPAEAEYATFKDHLLKEKKENAGIWIYYPWLNKACLCPPEDIYLEIFTSRNKTLITGEEQKNYYNLTVGIAGLSVGQSIALAISRSGGAKHIKIADMDVLSPTNLNRVHFGVNGIGEAKTTLVAQRLYETNPYHEVTIFEDGITEKNIDDFVYGNQPLDLIIDACDYFPAKLALREKAREAGIPLIMSTDINNAVLVDIERYDQDKTLKPFDGRLEKYKDEANFLKAAVAVISPDNMSLPMQDAFFEIGKTIATHPQLGGTIYMLGAITAYAARCLANHQEIAKKRIYIDLDHFFDPRFEDENYLNFKEEKTKIFKQILGMKD